MAEEIAVENGLISNFKGLVTLTMDRVILHTVVHHSSISTYTSNFIEIKETFCGRTDKRTHVRTYARKYVRTDGRTFDTGYIRSTLSKSRPKTGRYLSKLRSKVKCLVFLKQGVEFTGYHAALIA